MLPSFARYSTAIAALGSCSWNPISYRFSIGLLASYSACIATQYGLGSALGLGMNGATNGASRAVRNDRRFMEQNIVFGKGCPPQLAAFPWLAYPEIIGSAYTR